MNLTSRELFITEDGSHSLLNKELNETYHSVHGAVQESQHVFINQGLKYWLSQNSKTEVKIFEVGFGTGLNAYLTLLYSTQHRIEYTSLEAYPLEKDIWSVLNYATNEKKHLFENIHASKWDDIVEITPGFSINKLKSNLQEIKLKKEYYDLIFFDAFAPSKQPEMWELPMLEKIYNSMAGKGVFVTYCAKGQLKRDLKSLGLIMETLSGPPGKKEMVRATKM
jgi:tRNA U34 5-methylaminomethyl-2-thiouridine-forming methyltransferase MnmC